MSEELQKEIDRLKAENSKLSNSLASAHEDLKEVRGEAKDRRLEGRKLTEQLAELAAERDKFKVAAQDDPEGLKAQVTELSGRLRDVAHRTAFAKVAAGLKVTDPTKVADLYALSGYKAESDTPDEKKMAGVVQEALKGRPHYLDTAAAAAQQGSGGAQVASRGAGVTVEQARQWRAPGSERGQSTHTESSSPPRERIPGRL
jgi:hypothetical protein